MRINTAEGESQADAVRFMARLAGCKPAEEFLRKIEGERIIHTDDRSVWRFFDGSEYTLIHS